MYLRRFSQFSICFQVKEGRQKILSAYPLFHLISVTLLCVDNFCIDDFSCSCLYLVYSANPQHRAFCFELFSNALLISHLLNQPKKKTSLSAYGDSDTNAIYRNARKQFTSRYSQVAD